MDRHRASPRWGPRRNGLLQLKDDSLVESFEIARSAFAEASAATAQLACFLAAESKSPDAAALVRGRIAAGMSHVGRAIGLRQRLRFRVRRASIGFAEYRTPGLYSRNQPRTNIVLYGVVGVNLPS